MANSLELGDSQISLFKGLSAELARSAGGGQDHSNEEFTKWGKRLQRSEISEIVSSRAWLTRRYVQNLSQNCG